MVSQNANECRARATQAQRIAAEMHIGQAQTELRDMATALDDEANRLELEETQKPTLPPERSE